MSAIKVAIKNVTVRRDAFSIIPVTVPAYEVSILRAQFGKENVQDTGPSGAFVEVVPGNEYERLSSKYGEGKVVKVFGDDGGARLEELVAKEAVKEGKAAKTAAAE